MEFGDDEMLLADSGPEARKVVEAFAEKATERGLGVQGKKDSSTQLGRVGMLIAPDLSWKAHRERRAVLMLKAVGRFHRAWADHKAISWAHEIHLWFMKG